MHNRMANRAAAQPRTSTRLRVLFLAPKICWPLDTGAKLRTYHLAREVARDCDVTFVGFRDTASKEPPGDSMPPPETIFEHTRAIPYAGGYTPMKLLRGALGRTPVSVLNYTTAEMHASLAALMEAGDYDVVQVESVHMMAYLPLLRAAESRPLLICDWHNVESELMARYGEHAESLPRRVYARLTARRLRQFERRALREFDAHVVVSERDRAQLMALDPQARVFVVGNGVDARYYGDDSARPAQDAHRVVFVGSMDYHANVEAAVRFAREVWPEIHRRHPELVFTIVGRNPSPAVRALGDLAGIEVTGTVDDVRPYYRESLCSVVPLRVGGGSRLKILEAMAAGVPVVSTTLGAEGLEAHPGRDLIIADTPESLSAAISRLRRDETARRRFAEAGRRFVRERYDWPALGGSLRDLYARLLDRPRSRAASPGVASPAFAELGV